MQQTSMLFQDIVSSTSEDLPLILLTFRVATRNKYFRMISHGEDLNNPHLLGLPLTTFYSFNISISSPAPQLNHNHLHFGSQLVKQRNLDRLVKKVIGKVWEKFPENVRRLETGCRFF